MRRFSLEPEELASLVRAVREAWDALGDADLLNRRGRPGMEHARSLFVIKDIAAGESFTFRACALHSAWARTVSARPAKKLSAGAQRKTLVRGQPLTWDDVE